MDVTPRACLVCGNTVSRTFRELEDHMVSAHAANRVVYCCLYCPEDFYAAGERNRHVVGCVERPEGAPTDSGPVGRRQ